MNKDSFNLVTDYPLTEYRCGARAGDQVRLRHNVDIKDSRGRRTGKVYPKGEVWTVLSGANEKPVVVWLRQTDGQTHTWDDGDVFLKTFEMIRSLTV